MTTASRICQTCVLPEIPPHITFAEDGVCNICKEFEAQERTPLFLESELIKILDKQSTSINKEIDLNQLNEISESMNQEVEMLKIRFL